jgi:hypothetical protein
MRRAWPSLLVVLGLLAFAGSSTRPAFEAGLVALALLATAALSSGKDPRDGLVEGRLARLATLHGPLALAGAFLTWPAWSADVPEVGFDGLMNEAIVAELVHQLERGRPLSWVTRIAPGDPVLDLYPTLPHRLVAQLAVWTGTTAHLDRWLVGALSVAYVAVALGIARTAQRLGAPRPAAFAAGLFAMLDPGTDFTWGTHAVFYYGYVPSTLGIAITLHTLPSLFDSLRRGGRAAFAATALGVALAAAVHPLSLVIALAIVLVLASLAIVSKGPRRHALLAPLLAALLGLAGSAVLWIPAGERVLAYAVHYGTPQVPLSLALARMADGQLPDGSFAALVALAWLAGLVALARPRALEARALALVAALLVFAYVDLAFLELGLAPSAASVRWQAFRIGAITKPLLYALGGHALGSGADLVGHWRARPAVARAARLSAAALALALLALAGTRWQGELATQAAERARDVRGPESTDPGALAALHGVLAADAEGHPGSRVLLVCEATCAWELFRFVRDSPVSFVLRQPAPAGLLLREQLATVTPENVRRFGIRWVVFVPDPDAAARSAMGRYRAAGLGGPPPERDPDLEAAQQVGDPQSERTFGRLRLRHVPEGDAIYAHVVAGTGTVMARAIDGEGFELTLSGTDAPALVEVGTPYYPRLAARHEDGTDVPVYALPVRAPRPEDTAPRIERAAALWLAPGTTRLRAEGALRSDADGVPLTLAALALSVAALVVRRAPGGRRAVDRLVARLLALELRLPALGALLAATGVMVSGAWASPLAALRFGALLPPVQVFVAGREGSAPCEPRALGTRFVCPDGAELEMTIGYGLREWQVGWPAAAPAISLRGADRASRYVLELPGLELEGAYFAHCRGCSATIRREGESIGSFAHRTARLELSADAPQIEVRPLAREAEITLLAARFLEPETEGSPPPLAPPAPGR